MAEIDVRQEFLNTLLTTPHRDLAKLHGVHQTMLDGDPRFYVRVAAWYADHGQVRDHKELFVAMLATSDFEGHRDVGLALLRQLPPYEVARVVDFVKGYEAKRRQVLGRPVRGQAAAQPGLLARVGRAVGLVKASQTPIEAAATRRQVEIITEKVGLFVNVPRSMRTEVERYLREREADPQKFDRVALQARKSLKRLYAGLHIQPSAHAQQVLFAGKPPEDSLAFKVKQIAGAQTPIEQAQAIAQYRIPYRIASTIIKEMSPTVLAALIDVMTPQEVINSVGSLKQRGAFDNPDIKALIDAKIKAAKTDKRVSAYKAKVAVEAAGATGELAAALDEVTEAQIKATGAITRATALLIDKSGSMNMALEVGKQLGAMISAIAQAGLYAYAFDTVAYPIEPRGPSLVDWEQAMAGLKAVGGTSCGVALDWLRRKGERVEQIVMVTDEGENTAPLFREAYAAYAEQLKVRPAVILIKIGQATTTLEQACAQLGVAPNVFEFRGDYYALPNVIPLLTYPSLADMVMEVLNYPLPQRKTR